MWNCAAAGTMSGTTTTMAEKMSIRQPTSSSSTLSTSRKAACECTNCDSHCEQPIGDAGVDEVGGQDGRRHDLHEDGADQRHRLARDGEQVALDVDVLVDEDLDDEDVERGERRDLGDDGEAAERAGR